jgi:hypothetical protein
MRIDDFLAMSAISLGVGQILVHIKDVYVSDDVSSYSIQSVLIGITSSVLWLIYQARKGANYSVVYMSAFLVSQLYILQRLVSKLKTKSEMN